MFHGGLLHVVIDRLELPDGETIVRELVLHPGAAAILPLLSDDRLLLVEQFRAPVGDSLLEIPAGKLDPGEAPLACAKRELLEETGYTAERWTPMSTFVTTPGFSDEKIHLFLARDLAQIAQRDEREIDRLTVVPLADALHAIRDGAIQDAKTALAVLSYAQTL